MPGEPSLHESIKRLAAELVDKAVGKPVGCHCAGACICDDCADCRTDGLAERAAEQGRQISATSPYGRWERRVMPGEPDVALENARRHKRREPCCEAEARRYLAALPPVAPDGADGCTVAMMGGVPCKRSDGADLDVETLADMAVMSLGEIVTMSEAERLFAPFKERFIVRLALAAEYRRLQADKGGKG